MHAFDPDDGAHGALLFHGDLLDVADVALAPGRVSGVVGGAALQNADKLGGAGNVFSGDADGTDEVRAVERDGALERAGIDEDGFAVVLDAESTGRGGRGAGGKRDGTLEAGGQDGSEAG